MQLLKENIDRLQELENDWLMEVSPDTCEVLRITDTKRIKVNAVYTIHGQQLAKLSKNILGHFILTNNLS